MNTKVLSLARQSIARLFGNDNPIAIVGWFGREETTFLTRVARAIAREAIMSVENPSADNLDYVWLEAILRVTQPDLVGSSDFVGYEATFTEIYSFATNTELPDYSKVSVEFYEEFIPMTWGDGGYPARCSVCGKQVSKIILVPLKVHDDAPYKKGESGFQRWVFNHR